MNKVIVKINNDNNTYELNTCDLKDRKFSYYENDDVLVDIYYTNNKVILNKVGTVNYYVEHEVDKSINVEYLIKESGKVFVGNMEIKTKSINIDNNKISIEFSSDDSNNIVSWEII